MWRPSEDAIGELITSELPYFTHSRLDVPDQTNAGWWSSKGIDVPSFISREDLFGEARAVRESGSDIQLIELLWHILAWGVVGNFRNVAQIVRAAHEEGGDATLLRALRPAMDASDDGDIERAYAVFLDHPINQLGPGFFTKFLYFTGNRDTTAARCLILDSLAAMAANAITGRNFNHVQGSRRRSIERYAEYCHLLQRKSEMHSVAPDLPEFRLYRLGKRFKNQCSWLTAEVSLYRDGFTPQTFDDIARVLVEPEPS